MIKVIVSGSNGRMGTMAIKNLRDQEDIVVLAGVDPTNPNELALTAKVTEGPEDHSLDVYGAYQTVEIAMAHTGADVLLELSNNPVGAIENVKAALTEGLSVVVGTTGVPESTWKEIANEFGTSGNTLLVVPNFSIGAIVMMKLSEIAARYMGPAEVIELHHDQKLDAPSGTASRTATMIAAVPEYKGAEQILVGDARNDTMRMADPARGELGAGCIPIHSVRLPGLVAHQEVLFGGTAQLLTIRHDSFDRVSFAPGIMLALRGVTQPNHRSSKRGTTLVIGLEGLMGL